VAHRFVVDPEVHLILQVPSRRRDRWIDPDFLVVRVDDEVLHALSFFEIFSGHGLPRYRLSHSSRLQSSAKRAFLFSSRFRIPSISSSSLKNAECCAWLYCLHSWTQSFTKHFPRAIRTRSISWTSGPWQQ